MTRSNFDRHKMAGLKFKTNDIVEHPDEGVMVKQLERAVCVLYGRALFRPPAAPAHSVVVV